MLVQFHLFAIAHDTLGFARLGVLISNWTISRVGFCAFCIIISFVLFSNFFLLLFFFFASFPLRPFPIFVPNTLLFSMQFQPLWWSVVILAHCFIIFLRYFSSLFLLDTNNGMYNELQCTHSHNHGHKYLLCRVFFFTFSLLCVHINIFIDELHGRGEEICLKLEE